MFSSIHSFPRAILHIDGDSFFASCEMAVRPSLKGKCVITGKERGIVSSMSYPAKARGVKRGMILSEVLRICPEAIILPSDYETYSLFSKRMFGIVRRYTSEVDEYGIDECFADLTGLRRPLKMTYEEMAERIKNELEGELGISFSIGLGPNKVVAKIGSKWKKPSGLTIIPTNDINRFIKDLPVEKVWGIGPQTTALLNKEGIRTAFEFARKSEEWVKAKLTKPHHEIWQELNGQFIYSLTTEEKHDYQSISKTKTFTPPSTDKYFVFSELSKNIENACIKARRHHLVARKIFFFLKTQDFHHHGLEIKLSNPLSIPQEIIKILRGPFEQVFKQKTLYRSTGIVLIDLVENSNAQADLFGSTARIEEMRQVLEKIDALDEKFGKHTVFLGSSMASFQRKNAGVGRNDKSDRTKNLFRGENARQRIGIPMLGEVK